MRQLSFAVPALNQLQKPLNLNWGAIVILLEFVVRFLAARNRLILLVFAFINLPLLAICSRAKADWKLFNPIAPCSGDCAFHISFGQFTNTDMVDVFGIGGSFVPIWQWDMEDSFLITGALSRRLLSYDDVFDVEFEAGLGQRFGIMHATEMWSALYFRWKSFPWNHRLYTTIALSTGLSYATDIDELERVRGGNGEGSKLQHFLSPEITFALPEHKEAELVLRFHHRSGGGDIFGPIELFNGVAGGAHHGTIGFRFRF